MTYYSTLSYDTRRILVRSLFPLVFAALCVVVLLAAIGSAALVYAFVRSAADSYNDLIDDMISEIEELLDW